VKETTVLVEEKYPELNKLIQMGKERGFIMYEELYEELPEEVTGIAEELDDIYLRLSELNIDVMDAEGAEKEGREKAAAKQTEKNNKKPVAKTESKPVATEQLEKTNDPVRMYLREMGTVKLLDREGEVDIAQRIEAGEAKVFIALSKEPRLLELFLRTNERARRDRRGVRELLQTHTTELDDKGRDRCAKASDFSGPSCSSTENRESSVGACDAARRPASAIRSCRTRSTQTPRRPRSSCGARTLRRPQETAF